MKMYNEDNVKEMTVEDYKLLKAEIEPYYQEDYIEHFNYLEDKTYLEVNEEDWDGNLGEFISHNESGEYDEYYKKADEIWEDIVKLWKLPYVDGIPSLEVYNSLDDLSNWLDCDNLDSMWRIDEGLEICLGNENALNQYALLREYFENGGDDASVKLQKVMSNYDLEYIYSVDAFLVDNFLQKFKYLGKWQLIDISEQIIEREFLTKTGNFGEMPELGKELIKINKGINDCEDFYRHVEKMCDELEEVRTQLYWLMENAPESIKEQAEVKKSCEN